MIKSPIDDGGEAGGGKQVTQTVRKSACITTVGPAASGGV